MDDLEQMRKTADATTRKESVQPDNKVHKAQKTRKRKTLENYALPDSCPVSPIGTNNGIYFYLDANKQFRSLAAGKHNRLEIMALFGDKASFLSDYWPRRDKNGDIEGWRPELAAQALMEACAAKGIVDLSATIRGTGCWQDENGNLVMHCGEVVYFGCAILPAGECGSFVYPAASPKPKPDFESDHGIEFGRDILSFIQSWKWSRPDIDPTLLLGWIGAAILGGALDWRPILWITGDKGTGKSTLLTKLIQPVLGANGAIYASDASAAGLWQSVGHSSLPIILDEQESEEDNRKGNNLIKLARHAASGGSVLRGGSDHRSADFTVRSAFLFSSILIPPLLGQDVSRMAVLRLKKLKAGSVPVVLDAGEFAQAGTVFRRRVLEQWPRFERTLSAYWEAMAKAGHGARGADQFGTLLACADLLLFDHNIPEQALLDEWTNKMRIENLDEAQDETADHERCAAHLLTSIVDFYRNGARNSIGYWIEIAAGMKLGDDTEAGTVLSSYGIKVHAANSRKFLRVAHSHRGLSKLFEGTIWAGRSGASGVWVQSLRRIDGAETSQVRFDGVKTRCVEIPLEQILTKDER
ncbi:MAG TPA: hypothetical protein PLE43_02955 [Alphaproteobacteria bacterium]|nr:hypothetical protein [Alphaproteobacteria bacterium]